MAECIGLHYTGLLNAVLGPVISSFGGRYKPGKATRGRPRAATQVDHTDLDSVKAAQARDSRIMMGASQIPGIKLDL